VLRIEGTTQVTLYLLLEGQLVLRRYRLNPMELLCDPVNEPFQLRVLDHAPYCLGDVDLFLKREDAVTRCLVYEDYFIVYHAHLRSVVATVFRVLTLIAIAVLLGAALLGLGSRLIVLRKMIRRLENYDDNPENLTVIHLGISNVS
jgi:hypothetical protein